MVERWALNPCVQLHWRLIDSEWLLYEDLSGGTHSVDHLSAAVLTCFESGTVLDLHELLAQLAADLAIDVTPDQAGTVLQQFQALGLLLPANPTSALHAAA